MNKIKLTKKGHKKVKDEHNDLVKNKQKKAIHRLTKARAMGDLSENSEYTAAKEALAFIEKRVRELTAILDNHELIADSQLNSLIVEVGNKVIVETEQGVFEYEIVGEFEADPMKKKLSHTSPIGQALVGKKKGESVEVEIPAGIIEYMIVDIK